MRKILHLVIFWLLVYGMVACQGEETAVPPVTSSPPHLSNQRLHTPSPPPLVPPSPTPTNLAMGTDGYPWWNDTVFYEVFVRSFYDSDSDGVGDLNGLIEKLDYLNDGDPSTTTDLGITGIWLMPIMESPSYHGYDVVDYYQVDQEYGTNEDFKRLMAEAHKRGIRIIVDLVMNHTSTQHPWFVDSRNPDSEYRDWYIWADENPRYQGPWGQEVWHFSPNGYYYGVFWEGMPDLNYNNPDVSDAMFEIVRFWVEEVGVDGFRLDAIKHMIEDGSIQENTPQTHEWLQQFHAVFKEANPQAFAVGEAWTSTLQVVKYIGDEVDAAFEFDMAEAILNSARAGSNRPIEAAQNNVVEDFPAGQYAIFITNHDQNRVMTQLGDNWGRARVAATILLTSPGVPFLYYGEEIGMLGKKPDEDIRRPMQWSAEVNAGFTPGNPWRDPFSDYEERNIALQTADPDSLLSHYRTLIHLRNNNEALRIGEWQQVEVNDRSLYAYLRYSDNQVLLVLINLDDEAVTDYTLDLAVGPLSGMGTAVVLFGDATVTSPILNSTGGFTGYTPVNTLPPQSSYVIRLK